MRFVLTGHFFDKVLDGIFYVYVSDVSKPDNYIFLFKLSPLTRSPEDMSDREVYLAVPNGQSVSLGVVPKGKYILEQIH